MTSLASVAAAAFAIDLDAGEKDEQEDSRPAVQTMK